MRLSIVAASRPRTARALCAHVDDWAYVGTSVGSRARYVRLLGAEHQAILADSLERVSLASKSAFLGWIQAVAGRYAGSLGWLSSATGTASPLQSSLYEKLCFVQIVAGWARDGRPTRRLVIVEDPAVLEVLLVNCPNSDSVRFLGTGRLRRVISASIRIIRIPLSAAYFCWWAVWVALSARIVARQCRRPMAAPSGRSAILLFSWLDDRCVARPPDFDDQHFGRLERILTAGGHVVWRLIFLRAPWSALRRLPLLAGPFILSGRFVGPGDVVRSVLEIVRPDRGTRALRFCGFDVRGLMEAELLRENGTPAAARYRLWYHALVRFFKDESAGVSAVIYPFENQGWEKLLCLAVRRYAPQVRLIGYQHTRVPPLLLNYYTRDARERPDLGPHLVVVSGQQALERLAHAGYPREQLAMGGALRYEHVSGEPVSASAEAGVSEAGRLAPAIVVALSASVPHARTLVDALSAALRAPILDDGRAVKVLLRPHPWLPWRRVGPSEDRLPPWIEVTGEPLDALLSRSAIVLCGGSTTAWLDAWLAGVPVVRFRPDLLDVDGGEVAGLEGITECTERDLRDALVRTLRSPRTAQEAARRAFRQRVFSPVDQRMWLRVLPSPLGGR